MGSTQFVYWPRFITECHFKFITSLRYFTLGLLLVRTVFYTLAHKTLNVQLDISIHHRKLFLLFKVWLLLLFCLIVLFENCMDTLTIVELGSSVSLLHFTHLNVLLICMKHSMLNKNYLLVFHVKGFCYEFPFFIILLCFSLPNKWSCGIYYRLHFIFENDTKHFPWMLWF